MDYGTARRIGMLGTAVAVAGTFMYAAHGNVHNAGVTILAWLIGFSVGHYSREGAR